MARVLLFMDVSFSHSQWICGCELCQGKSAHRSNSHCIRARALQLALICSVYCQSRTKPPGSSITANKALLVFLHALRRGMLYLNKRPIPVCMSRSKRRQGACSRRLTLGMEVMIVDLPVSDLLTKPHEYLRVARASFPWPAVSDFQFHFGPLPQGRKGVILPRIFPFFPPRKGVSLPLSLPLPLASLCFPRER